MSQDSYRLDHPRAAPVGLVPPRHRAWSRWSRPLAVGLAALGLAIFVFWLAVQLVDPRYASLWGVDRGIYRGAAERLLVGGSWFYPEQLAGPYETIVGHVMYPPVAIAWFVPAAFLPDVVWWAVPLAVIAAVVAWHRPSAWGWAGIAACLAYPPTSQMLVSGNPGLWMAAACAIGTIWRPAFAFILLKPSLFPFALLGARDPRWWGIVAAGAVVSLATLPMTLEWVGVILNARGQFSGPLYAIRDVGWILLPLVAYVSRQRPAGRTSGSP